MSTAASAEQHALRGLLLILVEAQNAMRSGTERTKGVKDSDRFMDIALATLDEVKSLVESAHAADLVQLARAVLDNPVRVVKPSAIPAAAAGVHA